ncbi:MAG: response regulator [Spirochaetes bacterium]|nr:response regulator [Spirochaetota bacterium]
MLKVKILVIEDDEVQYDLLEALFQKINAQGVFCSTGEAGIEKLQNHFFDCVLLDLGLPGKSGLQVLKTIRENPILKDLAVIVLTATKTRDSLQVCMRYGISDYVGKPYDLQKFAQKLQILENALALKRTAAGKPAMAHVGVERNGSIAKFVFSGVFNDESVRKFLSLYNSQFKAQTKGDSILINLAMLPDMNEPQVRMFKVVLSATEPKTPLIVAGRSYGPLTSLLGETDAQLFLIEDDALEFLNVKA